MRQFLAFRRFYGGGKTRRVAHRLKHRFLGRKSPRGRRTRRGAGHVFFCPSPCSLSSVFLGARIAFLPVEVVLSHLRVARVTLPGSTVGAALTGRGQ